MVPVPIGAHLTEGRHPRFFREMIGSDGDPAMTEGHLETIAAKAVDDGALAYNPVDADASDLLRMVRAAWEGIDPLPDR